MALSRLSAELRESSRAGSRGLRHWRRCLAVGVTLLCLATGRDALGLIVMNIDPTPNYSAPTAATSGFATNPDPGWGNITGRGVYLGNQWVIATYHTTNGAIPLTESIGEVTYNVIPGSVVYLQNSIVDNNGDGKDDSTGLTLGTDLIMYRIDTNSRYVGTPDEQLGENAIKPITISSASAPNNAQLMVMGVGRLRVNHTLYHWDATVSNGKATWTGGGPCVDCFHNAANGGLHAVGFHNPQSGDPEGKAWGTNNVEPISSSNFPDDPNDATDVLVIPGSASRAVKGGAGYTMMQIMDFDTYSPFTMDAMGNVIGGGGNEAQGTGGDSGSAVFRRVGTSWELTGLVHSIANYIHTSRSVAIRRDNGSQPDTPLGDVTLFSDLSKYRSQIMGLLNDTNYSIMGDINLDGQVSGDGTGSWETDDVTALIQGWGYQHSGAADIVSWKYGDLNRDGVTNIGDFVVLRAAMGESGAGLDLGSFFSLYPPAMVPEPATWSVIGGLALGMLATQVRRRRGRSRH